MVQRVSCWLGLGPTEVKAVAVVATVDGDVGHWWQLGFEGMVVILSLN